MSEFLPHLETLPPAQMRLWAELSEIPRDFVLYADTALALHLGHRDSVDFDFFGSRTFDVRALETAVSDVYGRTWLTAAVRSPSQMNRRPLRHPIRE